MSPKDFQSKLTPASPPNNRSPLWRESPRWTAGGRHRFLSLPSTGVKAWKIPSEACLSPPRPRLGMPNRKKALGPAQARCRRPLSGVGSGSLPRAVSCGDSHCGYRGLHLTTALRDASPVLFVACMCKVSSLVRNPGATIETPSEHLGVLGPQQFPTVGR